MAKIGYGDYLSRNARKGAFQGRDWWMVKYSAGGARGIVEIGGIYLPKEMVGKRVKFKIFVEELK